MLVRLPRNPWNIRFEAFLLAAYCALIPLENVLAASAGGSVNKYIGLLIIVLLGINCLRRGVITITYYIPILCFFAFSLASSIWSIGADNSYLRILINMTFCTLIFIQMPLRRSEYFFVLYSIVFAGAVLSILMLTGSKVTSINLISSGRMTLVFGGLMIDNNNLAVSIGICAIIAFHFLYTSKKPVLKAFWLVCFFLITMAIFYTGSRGGLLAEVVGLALYIWKSGNGIKFRTVLVVAIVVVLFSIIFQYFLMDGLAQRFSLYDVISSGGTGRIKIWGDALKSYSDENLFRQLFGFGFGTFGKTQEAFWGHYTASHNDFIGMFIEVGLIGLLLYISIWVNMLKKTINDRDWLSLSLLAVVLVGSISLEMLIKKMLWLVWYLVLVKKMKQDTVAVSDRLQDNS